VAALCRAVDSARTRGFASVSRLDLTTLAVTTVGLVPDPDCPSCAGPAPHESWDLVSRPKPVPESLRLRAPGSYRLPTDALVNPVTGLLGHHEEHDLISPSTTAVAGTFFDRGREELHEVSWSGKAPSLAGSRDLALLEGLERYAGIRPRGPREILVDTLANLGPTALDPRTCGEYSAATYESDPRLRRFSPTDAIRWLPGYSLRDERPVWVPERLGFYGGSAGGQEFVFECSNGCAIGSCLEEATLHGLLELVERDAFLLGWYAGQDLTGVDLASVPSPRIRDMVNRAHLHRYDVRLLDNRVDIDIPVVTAVAVRRDGGPGRLSIAAAASLDPVSAAEAALAEVLTYLPYQPVKLAARRAEAEAMLEDFDRVAELPDHALLFALPGAGRHAERYLEPAASRSFAASYPTVPPATDLLEDLRRCCDLVVAAGSDVVVVDQTTPDQVGLGLRTVRVLAPGLLPIDFGWSRQRALRLPRLRSAHLRAGLRRTALSDADLHLVPHPFP
jgi:ribosomal protein S12 methylthiotransferase accessory factor